MRISGLWSTRCRSRSGNSAARTKNDQRQAGTTSLEKITRSAVVPRPS
jgi:hypothetical protein